MFTTVDRVKDLTGYDVTPELLYQAQALVEMFTGRQEASVEKADDLEILNRATAYQAAYMSKNYETIFEQVGLINITGTDNSLTFDIGQGSPYIAPLAAFCLRGLSTKGSRSLKIGSMFGRSRRIPWERD